MCSKSCKNCRGCGNNSKTSEGPRRLPIYNTKQDPAPFDFIDVVLSEPINKDS